MSVFNIQAPSEIRSSADMEKVKSYLYMLNEQLTYMFGNLTPEDNYSETAYLKYVKDGEKVTRLELTINGVKLEMVKKGEVVSAINMSEEEIKIMASKIKLEGIVTANGWFKILEDGSMKAVNGEFDGKVSAKSGSIGDWTIEEGIIKGSANSKIIGGTVQGSNVTGVNVTGAVIKGSQIGDQDGLFFTDSENVWIGGFQAYETSYGQYIATAIDETNGIGNNWKYAVWTGWNGSEAAFYATEYGDIQCEEIYSEVAGESWSDERLKEDIREIDGELAEQIVINLRPVFFTMKKSRRPGIGFVAQDVYMLCKRLGCSLPLYGYTPDRKYFSIPYQNYIGILTAAYQKQKKKMDAMESRLSELERKLGYGK